MRRTGQGDRAADYYQRANDLAVELGDPTGIAGTALNLGLILEELGRTDEALGRYREALAGFETIGNPMGISMALHNIGNTLSDLDAEDPEAATALGRALAIREGLDDPRGLAATLGAMAELEHARGRPAVALGHVERALAISDAVGGTDETPLLHLSHSAILAALGDTARALEALRTHLRLITEVHAEATRQAIAETEARLGLERAEKELEVRTVELEKERSQRQLLGVVVVLLVALVIAIGIAWNIGRRARRRLSEMARTDLLTGVANRRALHELLEREMARAERTGAPLALAMVDVDDFKGFNDRHGHELGDAVLREVARRLHASVRRADAVGRWGGEEFLVVLADTDGDGGRVAAEGLRSRIADQPLAVNGDRHSLTVSVGIAQHRPGLKLDRLLRDADDALYRAKAAGKNRVELAT